MKDIELMPPICVDDYGDEVHRCRFTDVLVWPEFARFVGSILPGVKAKYVSHIDSREAERKCIAYFHESEANCNTCRHLMRVPFKARPHAPYVALCLSTPVDHPYGCCGPEITFHPNDWMGMKCWEARVDGE